MYDLFTYKLLFSIKKKHNCYILNLHFLNVPIFLYKDLFLKEINTVKKMATIIQPF